MSNEQKIVSKYLANKIREKTKKIRKLRKEIKAFEKAVGMKGYPHVTLNEWKKHAEKMCDVEEEKKIIDFITTLIDELQEAQTEDKE